MSGAVSPLAQARAALREKQGTGARYDAPEAPALTLEWARTGTAYFARLLNNLSDADLEGAALTPPDTRRHVIARVGYQARALTRVTEGAARSPPQPMYHSEAAYRAEIENGVTLPARALRGLFRHASVHLDVEWRDLDGAAWATVPDTLDMQHVQAAQTPWLRSCAVWLGGVDLNVEGSFNDMPPAFLDRLIAEALGRNRHVTVSLTDRDDRYRRNGGVSGTAADCARWLTGRGVRHLTHTGALPPLNPERGN